MTSEVRHSGSKSRGSLSHHETKQLTAYIPEQLKSESSTDIVQGEVLLLGFGKESKTQKAKKKGTRKTANRYNALPKIK